MVKNLKGGKAFKTFKKTSNQPYVNSGHVRTPDNELEIIGLVTKFYGNTCDILVHDGKTYRCWIRGKFRGSAMRNSKVTVGSFILAGFRHFEYPNYKNLDLLEVYEHGDIVVLQRIPGLFLPRTHEDNCNKCDKDKDVHMFEFDDANNDNYNDNTITTENENENNDIDVGFI